MEYIKKKSYICIAFISALLVLYFIWNYAQKVPFWDQWEFVPVLEKLHYHTLKFADLWQQHNEHRILFPKILMLILAYFSGWNFFVEFCAILVISAINLFLLYSILDKTIDSRKSIVLKIIMPLLIFSMIQYENWSCSWQIQIYMSVFGAIIAMSKY